MRAAAPAMAAAMVVLAACTGGDGTGAGPGSTPSTVSTTAPSTTATTVASITSSTTSPPDPPGASTLRTSAFTLPDLRTGGSGLRLLVRATSPRLTVRRQGGGGAVAVCPVAAATTPATTGACRELTASGPVEVPSTRGVELRATGAEATVDEVTITYLPADRTTTLVTPARPAGACEARPCEATFALTPAAAGSFSLDGRAGGGRPRLVLTSVRVAAGGSNRMLATVEGGGMLSIRATVEAGSQATLLHQEQGPGAIFPVTAEISWP